MLSAEGYGVLPILEVDEAQLTAFDCGKTRLNEFVKGPARKMHEGLLGFTSVVFHEDVTGPLGYFTLASDSLALTNSEQFELDVAEAGLSHFPAVKIGRLAVRSDYQGQGVGQHMVNVLILGAVVGTQLSAARLLVLDADNEDRVVSFYAKLGFEKSLWAERKSQGKASDTVKMIRDILKA